MLKMPPHVNAPRYTTRSVADLLGNWTHSFVSKLSVVSAELDAGARAFALKHRIGWQACYEACVERRQDCADEPIMAYLSAARLLVELAGSHPEALAREVAQHVKRRVGQ